MKINRKSLGPLFITIGACLWGTETYFRVHLNEAFDSDILVFIEHFFCILFCLPVLAVQRPRWRGFSKRAWIYILLSGSLGSAIGTFFFTESLRFLNYSVANVLLNFQPVVSVLFAAILLHEHLTQRFFIWAVLALICGLFIVAGDFSIHELHFNAGLALLALTAVCWGFSTVAGRGTMLEMPLSTGVFLRFVIGFVTLFFVLLAKGKIGLIHFSTVRAHLGNFVGLSLVSGTIPLYFYFEGLSKTPASIGGFCEMAQTFAAVIMTWGVLGNKLTPVQCLAGLFLLFTIYKINTSKVHA